MGSSIQRYYPGGSQTISQGPGGGGPGYAPAFQLAALLAQRRQPVVVEPQVSRMGVAAPRHGGGQRQIHDATNNDPVDFARQRAAIAQARAISDPAPMRMTTFASGANNYLTPDTNVMSGAQRQMYLPQAAQQTPLGAATGWQGGPSATDQYQAFVGEAQQRRAIDERNSAATLSPKEMYAMQLAQQSADRKRGGGR